MAILAALTVEPALAARTHLPLRQLLDGRPTFNQAMPLDVAFAPDANASDATAQVFAGTLFLTGGDVAVPWRECNTAILPGGCEESYSFPASTRNGIEFVQSGPHLLPVRRGPITLDSGWWDLIVQPGRVWTEPSDQGYARAAVPFALEEKNANCMHNGVMTFVFRSGQQPGISKVAIEIATETCLYNRFDMVGLLHAEYRPAALPDRKAIRARHVAEQAARMPTRPIARLRADFPDLALDPQNLRIGTDTHNTTYGLVVRRNGRTTHYVSDCQTRHGRYPYCDELVLPSYSLAKSVYAALALMRLQAIDGAAGAARIADYVRRPPCSPPTAAIWEDVSFEQTLDMATGNFGSSAYMRDEDERMAGLFVATRHDEKLAYAWCHFPRAAAPGSTFAYHSSDTYLLGHALQEYLRTLPGRSAADLFADLVVRDLYGPLGLSQTARFSRRTTGAGDPGQTFTGWGLALTRGDVALLGQFLSLDSGRMAGVQLLDERMLQAALQRLVAPPAGLPTRDPQGVRWYKHGFWARDLAAPLGCRQPTHVPALSGYGGITVALFPPVGTDGVVYYNFSDEGTNPTAGAPDVLDWSGPAAEARKLGDFCR